MNKLIEKISLKNFGSRPLAVNRFKIGLCNEVYDVDVPGHGQLIFRLNKDGKYFKGAQKYIPIFKSLGIRVPEIIISDYSMKVIPLCYQILKKITGKDLGEVFEDLGKAEIQEIAQEVVNIFNKTKTLPTDGSFGWVDFTGQGKYNSWSEAMQSSVDLAIGGGKQTGLLTEEFETLLSGTFDKNKVYFSQVKSKAYYDDIASKNVLIDNDKFSGLVDIDGISYGDFLEAVGRIKADFIDRKNGDIYITAVEDGLGLNQEEKRLVLMYALMNRIFWFTGNGIKFNENSPGQVDKVKAAYDTKVIKKIQKLLNI